MNCDLYWSDCFDFLPNLPDASVDLVLADLDYGLTSNQWDNGADLDRLWTEYLRVGTPSTAFVFTASMPFSARLVMSKVELFRHEWIWIKNRGSNFANTTREPFKEHESVLVFSRGQWTFNRQMQPRTGSGAERVNYELNWRSKSSNYRDFEDREGVRRPKLRVPSSWQKFNVEVGLHPTQKPVPLFAYLVRTYTNENDLVLDTHSGSGTTAMACVGTKRNFVGCEKDRAYWEKAVNRLEAKLKPLGAQSAERGQWSF